MDNTHIQETLKYYYRYLLQYFDNNDIIGVFLFGSQNYGLSTINSDIDVIAIVTENVHPQKAQFIDVMKQQRSIILDTDGVCEHDNHIIVKTIDLFIDEIIECSDLLNYEILFTSYYILNPLYQTQFSQLQALNNDIAYYNYNCFLKKQIYQEVLNHYRYILAPETDPNQMEVIKFGYTPKKLLHLKRLVELANNYSQCLPYTECLKVTNVKQFYRLKHHPYGKTLATTMAKQYYKQFIELIYTIPIVTRKTTIYNFLNNYTIMNERN